MGAFMVKLRGRGAIAARGLELLILTAARTSEVTGARWDELDFTKKVWTVPASRMKSRKKHRVPLSPDAISVLQAMRETRQNDFIFPGNRPNSPLSNMAFLQLLKRLERDDLTVHGFRSSFRDWAAERTATPREVAEMALAHAVPDKVEAAYLRSDLFDKRRRLMDDWARFCTQTPWKRARRSFHSGGRESGAARLVPAGSMRGSEWQIETIIQFQGKSLSRVPLKI